jgi:hypothetical protein
MDHMFLKESNNANMHPQLVENPEVSKFTEDHVTISSQSSDKANIHVDRIVLGQTCGAAASNSRDTFDIEPGVDCVIRALLALPQQDETVKPEPAPEPGQESLEPEGDAVDVVVHLRVLPQMKEPGTPEAYQGRPEEGRCCRCCENIS